MRQSRRHASPRIPKARLFHFFLWSLKVEPSESDAAPRGLHTSGVGAAPLNPPKSPPLTAAPSLGTTAEAAPACGSSAAFESS